MPNDERRTDHERVDVEALHNPLGAADDESGGNEQQREADEAGQRGASRPLSIARIRGEATLAARLNGHRDQPHREGKGSGVAGAEWIRQQCTPVRSYLGTLLGSNALYVAWVLRGEGHDSAA